MSSLIAHLAAGATAYVCRNSSEPRRFDGGLIVACLALAVLPDLDYLLWWFAHIQLEPRLTHSLGFALASAGLAWLLLRVRRPAPHVTLSRPAALSLLAAALSHELLDFLVGVHPSPWLWPLAHDTFVSPVGVLPSAGRLDVSNFYFWRNLAIEVDILGPVFAALCVVLRREWRLPRWVQFGLLIVFALSLPWALSLPR